MKEVVTEFVRLNEEITSVEKVFRELDRRGLRPATIEQLLAFAAKYPAIQKQFPIVALGSAMQDADGHTLFPYLCGHPPLDRSIRLSQSGSPFSSHPRFLAARE